MEQANGKHGQAKADAPEKRAPASRKFGAYLLASGLALGAATCGGSSSPSKATDAAACQMVKNDAGMDDCSPKESCELRLVSPTDGATPKAACVPKAVSAFDGGAGEASVPVSEAGVPVDTAPAQALDASVAADAAVPVDSKPACGSDKKARVYATVGRNWRVSGFECESNGSATKFDNGDVAERKTDGGDFEPCAVAAADKQVVVTCPSVTVQAGVGGCTQSAAGETSACSDVNRITVTGSTKVSTLGSRTVVKVSMGAKSEEVYLVGDGSPAGTKNLNPAGTPVTATLTSLGVGDDGKVVVAGKVDGPEGKSTCGTAVGSSAVAIGDVSVSHVVSQTNVRPDSAFRADFVFDGNSFDSVPENGTTLVLDGTRVNYTGTVKSDANGAVRLEEATGNRSCVLEVGRNTGDDCQVKFNGKSLTVRAVYHTNSCIAQSDASVVDAVAAAQLDAGAAADATAGETSQ